MRLAAEAKKSSVLWRMRAPSGAEIRSVVVVLKVASIWSAGMEVVGLTSWMTSGERSWTSIVVVVCAEGVAVEDRSCRRRRV